jgi:DNA-binding CsgD family transcriptional regulator
MGVMICTRALDRVLLANEAAHRLLGELGVTHSIQPALRQAIAASREHEALISAFTRAVRVALPSGRRLFVRTRPLRDALLITLTGEVLREQELFELLQRRFDLSIRERQVIVLVRAGHGNEHIGRELGISVGTVKQYLNRTFKAFQVHSRGELVALIERIARDQAVD